jgi:hypothetical protein
MKTWRVIVTYKTEPEFTCTALKAETEREARRMAAQIAAQCGWRELPKWIISSEVKEAA